jgi:hypothetical protein
MTNRLFSIPRLDGVGDVAPLGLGRSVWGVRYYKGAGPTGLRARLKTEGSDRIRLVPFGTVTLAYPGGSMTFHTRS